MSSIKGLIHPFLQSSVKHDSNIFGKEGRNWVFNLACKIKFGPETKKGLLARSVVNLGLSKMATLKVEIAKAIANYQIDFAKTNCLQIDIPKKLWEDSFSFNDKSTVKLIIKGFTIGNEEFLFKAPLAIEQ